MVSIPLMILAVAGLAIWLRPWPLFLEPGESRTLTKHAVERNVAWEFGKWIEQQAQARGLNIRCVGRDVPLECPKCHKTSNYFVYPDEVCERCWRASLRPVSTPIKTNHP